MRLRPAFELIKNFEGCFLTAYKDPVGVWTIGYGTTIYPDGTRVKHGDRCTLEQAQGYVVHDFDERRIPAIKKYVRVPLSDNETCALISFTYNVGVGALAESTLLRKLNNGFPRATVANEFLKWNKAGGKVLNGLTRRRKAERELFLTPDGKKAAEVSELV